MTTTLKTDVLASTKLNTVEKIKDESTEAQDKKFNIEKPELKGIFKAADRFDVPKENVSHVNNHFIQSEPNEKISKEIENLQTKDPMREQWKSRTLEERIGVEKHVLYAADFSKKDSASIQKTITSRFAQAHSSYKLPDGTRVRVPPQFRMNEPGASPTPEAAKVLMRNALPGREDLKLAMHRAAYGKATPEQVQKLTQALIGKGELEKLYRQFPDLRRQPREAIELLQKKFGIGIDCSAYTLQTFLKAHGGTASSHGTNDAFQGLKNNKKFNEVRPHAAKAGDIFSFKGHVAIVSENRSLTNAERARFGAGPNVQIIKAHSSWGINSESLGGVGEKTWLYDKDTGKWAEVKDGAIGPFKDKPYRDYDVIGIFRRNKR